MLPFGPEEDILRPRLVLWATGTKKGRESRGKMGEFGNLSWKKFLDWKGCE